MEIRRTLTKKIRVAGAGMLLGCDAPQYANVPGFSMHREVKAYQASGLSNLDIMKRATINAARFFEKTDAFGTIQEGREADLVLLDGNPLEDRENLRKPIGAVPRGRWLKRDYLKGELEKIAAKSRQAPCLAESLGPTGRKRRLPRRTATTGASDPASRKFA